KVDADWAALQEEEVSRFVRGTFLSDAPVVRVSAVTGEGLPALTEALDAIASRAQGKDTGLFFRLPVDRSFSMKGFGTVVTGTVTGGTVRSGDEVQVLPGGPIARVRGLQVHGGTAESSSAGTRTAVNLQGVEKESVPRGSVLCHPGTLSPTKEADAFVEYLPMAPRPMKRRARVSFHSGTSSSLAKVLLLGTSEIPPGGSGYARIILDEEIVLMGGDRFILRGFSPLENFGYTIGGGRVLNPYPARRKGTGKAVPQALSDLRSPEASDRVLAALQDAGRSGLGAKEAAVIAGVGLPAAQAETGRLASFGKIRADAAGSRYWHAASVEETGGEGIRALTVLHDRFPDREGFPREEIAAQVPGGADPELVALALAARPDAGKAGDFFFLPAKRPRSVELSSPLAQSIAAKVRETGLSALSRAELGDLLRPTDRKEFEKTLDALVKGGAVLRVKELFFDLGATGALKEKLVSHLERKGEITVPEFKDLAGGLSRKYVIPLLEHFDMSKVTLRIGDKRVLRKGK
ncbi:MAG: SelB C-terminal domain-containing protein, partial [Candidatus Deferrimicrobiaceae bacterium]